MSNQKPVIFWFRRDLRLADNRGLFHALKSGKKVVPVFIFDTNILDKLEDKGDRRVTFIHDELSKMNDSLREHGSTIRTFHGKPIEVWKRIIEKWSPSEVYLNEDYSPYARDRDSKVYQLLQKRDIRYHGLTDHVVQHPGRVLKDDGQPYTVYTPYMKKWKSIFDDSLVAHCPSEQHLDSLLKMDHQPIIPLDEMGFKKADVDIPSKELDTSVIKGYHNTRDIPGKNGTSKMSVHLRFGTVSTRYLMRQGVELNNKYYNELIWREFYQMILWHFPKSASNNFRSKYDLVEWDNNEEHFARWCEGTTGFPIVDAGMRELKATGYMHNRVRMITASFLTKDLLIDWRWGERWFARQLLDYDLASNVGGWQWAAGTGVDAAPYFRIFNPTSQQEKFDPKFEYIKKWVPEFGTNDYPKPIIDHKEARKRTLDAYKEALDQDS